MPVEKPIVLQDMSKTPMSALIDGFKELLPAAGLVMIGGMLVTNAMPAGNKEVMLTVVGALAGFLTGRASKGSSQ